MRKILITGGFGFIGSHLVQELIADARQQVHVVDNLSTSPVDLKAYLAGLGRPKNLTHDLCSVEQFCQELAAGHKFDEIYHLASIVGPVGVLAHAGHIAHQIINDTQSLIDLALRTNARLLDVSTSEVYGGGRDGYCSEKDFKVIQPKVTVRLEYAIGKLTAEVALINTSRVTSLDVAIVRPFNVAGPRQTGTAGFVLPRFISQAMNGEPLTVYGDGQMIRAFTHVRDIVRGIILVMEKGERGEPYNIGNPANKISIQELAERVLRVTRSDSKIAHVDPKEIFGPLFEEANDKYPDADRAIHHLGWQPVHGIEEIILDSFDYIKSGRRD
jgi:UDP-glucose 4-epimerase